MIYAGIENENEFYPSGALPEAISEEVGNLANEWADLNDISHPVVRLSSVVDSVMRTFTLIRNVSDSERKEELIRGVRHVLLDAIGYVREPQTVLTALSGEPEVLVSCKVLDSEGKNALWIIETSVNEIEDEAVDPLSSHLDFDQLTKGAESDSIVDQTIDDILTEGIFDLPSAPKYVIVLGLSQVTLVEKKKWPTRSALRFNLQEIFEQSCIDTLTAVACLISREARVPDQGISISDRLEDELQRSANAVTTSLKKSVRDAIEILGQEVLDITEGKYPSGHSGQWINGSDLSQECLRYMYRLLFLFYAESNSQLSLLDTKNPIYMKGYSLEFLRDFETIPLRSTADREGTFLWDTLQCTLLQIYNGLDCVDEERETGLRFPSVKIFLLSRKSTPLLSSLKLRNEAIQKVIRRLSLRSTGKGTSRISYSNLGIGQLGAVYETLISFKGVIAKEDLIEVKTGGSKAAKTDTNSNSESTDSDGGHLNEEDIHRKESKPKETTSRHDSINTLEPCRFVSSRRFDEFGADRVVYLNNQVLIYKKGTFIYRLASRDRERAASYYTPQPLARLLVKHAILERCETLKADELLDIKILEPAMGSAAFLVEAANQIAELYIERKQIEVRRTIPQEKIITETQRVRALIADRNCFGVDMNPIAVDLGAISLWLNSLHASDFSPWFGNQLHTGNSLLGARRASYDSSLLRRGGKYGAWINKRPTEIGWNKDLPDGHVWHWLLPFKGMVNFESEKTISSFAKDEQGKIREWKNSSFFGKFKSHEVDLLRSLSHSADKLLHIVADDLEKIRKSTNDEITIWPDSVMKGNRDLDFVKKELIISHLIGKDDVNNTLPYKRLKTAMDAWCSLWIWPIRDVWHLPSREEYLQGMAMILEGGFTSDGELSAPSLEMFNDPALNFHSIMNSDKLSQDTQTEGEEKQHAMLRETNVEALIHNSDWLKASARIASKNRFVHFDLIFADILRERGGFDLIVGNPPWMKPSWNEGKAIADIDPSFIGLSAAQSGNAIEKAFGHSKPGGKNRHIGSMLEIFLDDFVRVKGEISAISSVVMNPFVGGRVTNLYHCFIDLSFRLVSKLGYIALIHQDGHLISPRMAEFRKNWYSRISKHFRFRNQIQTKMFSEIGHRVRFSLNVYRGSPSEIQFDAFCDAFLASQIDDSYSHDGTGDVGGIKDRNGKWNTSAHSSRIIRFDRSLLKVIRSLTEAEDVPVDEARLLLPHSTGILDLFRRLSRTKKVKSVFSISGSDARVGSGASDSFCQICGYWSESDSQRDGTITRVTGFQDVDQMILQGPHFGIANPIFQTPRRVCNTHGAYDPIDLTLLTDSHCSRTNYLPAVKISEFRNRMPKCLWDKSKVHADHYRMAFRRMISRDGERSLVGAPIPPNVTHVNTVMSAAFSRDCDLISALASFISLPLDFFVKVSAMEDLDMSELPWVNADDTARSRALRLTCATLPYAELWNKSAPKVDPLPWSSSDRRLKVEGDVCGPKVWNRSACLRSEFARRLALVEIDVLISQELGFSLNQLIDIYGIYFPVLQSTESGTWYDQNGRIVWTCSKSLTGVGWLDDGMRPSRAMWDKTLAENPEELVCTCIDDTVPNGPREIERRFVGPFTRCDRVADYRRAWAHFEKLKAEGGA